MIDLNVTLQVPDPWEPGNCYSCLYSYIVPYETEDDGYDEDICCGIDNTADKCPLEKAWMEAGYGYTD